MILWFLWIFIVDVCRYKFCVFFDQLTTGRGPPTVVNCNDHPIVLCEVITGKHVPKFYPLVTLW